MYGYRTIFARRTRNFSGVLESSRPFEMMEAYESFYYQRPAVVTNTPRWRLASFQDVCSEDYSDRACRGFSTSGNDHLFKNEAAPRAFKNL